jgi:NAD(P)-dependent dehydrogenase (short-subunit alcohol dehydrogenase family)
VCVASQWASAPLVRSQANKQNCRCLCLQEGLESLKGRTQMGRPGQPCECGTCYVFLASEDGSYISGQTLHPNGGDVLNT